MLWIQIKVYASHADCAQPTCVLNSSHALMFIVLFYDLLLNTAWNLTISGSKCKSPSDTVKPRLNNASHQSVSGCHHKVLLTSQSSQSCSLLYIPENIYFVYIVNNTTLFSSPLMVFSFFACTFLKLFLFSPPFCHHAKFVANSCFLSCLILLQILVIWYTGLYLFILTLLLIRKNNKNADISVFGRMDLFPLWHVIYRYIFTYRILFDKHMFY